MSQMANNVSQLTGHADLKLDQDLNARLLRTMVLTTVVVTLVAALMAPWRVTTGIALGGVLAVLNHRWLLASTTAAFGVLLQGQKPRITIFKYALRYIVVGAAIFTANELHVASLLAMFAGLSTFVMALFVEASRQFYFAIITREETN